MIPDHKIPKRFHNEWCDYITKRNNQRSEDISKYPTIFNDPDFQETLDDTERKAAHFYRDT